MIPNNILLNPEERELFNKTIRKLYIGSVDDLSSMELYFIVSIFIRLLILRESEKGEVE